MTRRRVLTLLGVCSLGILGASLAGGAFAEIAFAFLTVVFPIGLMGLGIRKGGRFGAPGWPVAVLLVVLLASVGGMFLFRGRVVGAPLWLGLPPAAAIQLVGLFLIPLVVTALGFAWTFRELDPSREELEELRSLAPGR